MRTRKLCLLPGLLCGFGIAFAFISPSAFAQTTAPNEWTWVGGSNKITAQGTVQPGVYGTLDSPASDNIPGGRDSAATWTDSRGNFWLFGGEGADANGNFGQLNDIWEFQPSTQEWTWIGGSSTVPASCAGSTTVACGQPGVYGTLGSAAAANIPGGRSSASYWADSNGNFWLFAGYGFDANQKIGELNDLWEFNSTTKEWTWMSGGSAIGSNGGQPGVFGTLGSAAAGNIPSGRDSATSWVDKDGQFWLYGGEGFDSQGNSGQLDDLWEFDPTTSEWAWTGGSSTLPAACAGSAFNNGLCGWPALYGTLGVPAAGISPGSRVAAVGWTGSDGNLWLFGGLGSVFWEQRDFSQIDQYDLWEFNPSTKQWAWMSGNTTSICGESSSEDTCGQDGIYGTFGTPSIANIPASRSNATGWTDAGGNLWLFGGIQSQTTNGGGVLFCNDTWEFIPSANEWAWMNGSSQELFYGSDCNVAWGSWGVQGTPASGNLPSGRNGGAGWTDSSGNFWMFGGFGWTANGGATDADLNDFWIYQPVAPAPEPSFEVIASPNPINIGAMGTGAPTITTGTATVNIVAADGFDSPVALTAAPLYSWAAVSGSLSPSTITGAGSSTLTISVTGAAVLIASSYPLTITATSGGVTQSIQVIVDVTSIGVSAPTFSPPAGTYSTPQTVTISDPAVGNEFIYYTTDGSTPTASSPVYVNPITITSTTMLKAIALQFDEGQSEVTTVTYNINLPGEDFSVAASPSSASVTAGQSGTTTVTIAPLNGFDSAVSFSCSGLPSGASCSFSPQTVTPSGGVASTTLNVTTNVSMAVMRRSAGPLFPISALAALVCCVGWKRRRLFQVLPLIAVSAVGLSLLNGCGSGNSGGVSSAPQSATYTITVNATSGSLQHSTSFSLTVN